LLVTSRFNSLALSLVVFVGAPSGAAPVGLQPQQTTVFHEGIDLVNFAVTVTDKKRRLVTDLHAEDFAVIEDGKPQSIRAFAAGDLMGPPLHVGVLIDVSESMEGDIAFTRTAAIKFLNALREAADITLVDFDTEVRAARYSQDDFPRLVERVRSQKTGGWTALYDAIGVYLDEAAQQDGRKVMLLYTDGGDTRSSLRLGELMDLLKASDVTVYAIGALQHQPASARTEQRMILQQIAETTGGTAFFPLRLEELDALYEQVATEVRAQYTIGYVSTNEKRDGAWRKVEIKVVRADGKDLRVRARKGYYAPARPH
jgi:Ca-activated chloride channel family protein